VALHFIPQSIRNDEKAMDDLRLLTKRNRQLIHPNILRIYDFIEEDGWAAVSTDVVEGDCIADLRCKRAGAFLKWRKSSRGSPSFVRRSMMRTRFNSSTVIFRLSTCLWTSPGG
jgi:hypothetical protein